MKYCELCLGHGCMECNPDEMMMQETYYREMEKAYYREMEKAFDREMEGQPEGEDED